MAALFFLFEWEGILFSLYLADLPCPDLVDSFSYEFPVPYGGTRDPATVLFQLFFFPSRCLFSFLLSPFLVSLPLFVHFFLWR